MHDIPVVTLCHSTKFANKTLTLQKKCVFFVVLWQARSLQRLPSASERTCVTDRGVTRGLALLMDCALPHLCALDVRVPARRRRVSFRNAYISNFDQNTNYAFTSLRPLSKTT